MEYGAEPARSDEAGGKGHPAVGPSQLGADGRFILPSLGFVVGIGQGFGFGHSTRGEDRAPLPVNFAVVPSSKDRQPVLPATVAGVADGEITAEDLTSLTLLSLV